MFPDPGEAGKPTAILSPSRAKVQNQIRAKVDPALCSTWRAAVKLMPLNSLREGGKLTFLYVPLCFCFFVFFPFKDRKSIRTHSNCFLFEKILFLYKNFPWKCKLHTIHFDPNDWDWHFVLGRALWMRFVQIRAKIFIAKLHFCKLLVQRNQSSD